MCFGRFVAFCGLCQALSKSPSAVRLVLSPSHVQCRWPDPWRVLLSSRAFRALGLWAAWQLLGVRARTLYAHLIARAVFVTTNAYVEQECRSGMCHCRQFHFLPSWHGDDQPQKSSGIGKNHHSVFFFAALQADPYIALGGCSCKAVSCRVRQGGECSKTPEDSPFTAMKTSQK